MAMSVEQLGKPLKVARKIQETENAVSLVLEIPDAHKTAFHYKAGQFVTFFMNINGEAINRSYSISTSPLVDSDFKVTVKKVPGGKGSTFLCDTLKEGDTLLTAPPAGQFFKPNLESAGVHYGLFAAGSGITPVFSIMKTVLASSPLNRVTLVFCNRTHESIIYRQELIEWEQKYANLKILHVLSNPPANWIGHSGRAQAQLVQDVLSGIGGKQKSEFYLCGPTQFMDLVRTTLQSARVHPSTIHQEDFAIDLKRDTDPTDSSWTFIGPAAPSNEKPELIIAELNGETVEVNAKEGLSILETLLEAGVQAPYSCMDGACMACMAKVQEGRVYQEDPGILTDENIDNAEALTCQAKPLSRIVKVSFDGL